MKTILLQHKTGDLERLQWILEKNGHDAVNETSVKKGISALLSDPKIDLVVSDINIPDRGGLYLLKYIRVVLRITFRLRRLCVADVPRPSQKYGGACQPLG